MLIIRQAILDNLRAITQIYDDAIVNTVATFDSQAKTAHKQKNWFRNHSPKFPIVVVAQEDMAIGWHL